MDIERGQSAYNNFMSLWGVLSFEIGALFILDRIRCLFCVFISCVSSISYRNHFFFFIAKSIVTTQPSR